MAMRGRDRAIAKADEVKRGKSVSRKGVTDFSCSVAAPVAGISSLHRTIGNQTVQRLFRSGVIQAKLRIGRPDNVYEREADRVADEVMRLPDTAVQKKPG